MASGGPGDHPVTDILYWELRPLQGDLNALVKRLHELSPAALHALDSYYGGQIDWFKLEQGIGVEVARELLSAKVEEFERSDSATNNR